MCLFTWPHNWSYENIIRTAYLQQTILCSKESLFSGNIVCFERPQMANLLNSFQLMIQRSPWLARIRLRRLRRRQSPRSLCQSRAKPEASLKQCSKTFYPSIEVKPLHLPVVCRTRFRRQVSVCHFTKELCPLVTLADNPLSIPRALSGRRGIKSCSLQSNPCSRSQSLGLISRFWFCLI